MAKNRRPISLSLRFSVYERDRYICQYCGRKPPDVELQLDHVYPVALGGQNAIDNLLTACRDCNIGKGARDPGLAMPTRPETTTERYLREKDRYYHDLREVAQHAHAGNPEIKAVLMQLVASADEGLHFALSSAALQHYTHHDAATLSGAIRGLEATGFIMAADEEFGSVEWRDGDRPVFHGVLTIGLDAREANHPTPLSGYAWVGSSVARIHG